MSFIRLAWVFAGMLTEEKGVEFVLNCSFLKKTQEYRKHADVCKIPLPGSWCFGDVVHAISVRIPRSKEPNGKFPV